MNIQFKYIINVYLMFCIIFIPCQIESSEAVATLSRLEALTETPSSITDQHVVEVAEGLEHVVSFSAANSQVNNPVLAAIHTV